MPLMSHHAIVCEIKKQISKYKLQNFNHNESPQAGKTVVALFEMHHDPVPNFLVQFISSLIKPDTIAIEQPIEYTTFLEKMRTDQAGNTLEEDDDPYLKSLQELTTMVSCPLVCIDAPDKIRSQENLDEAALDNLRNTFMALSLIYFLPGHTSLTINGLAHRKDFSDQLSQLDKKITMIPIEYHIDQRINKASAIMEKDGVSVVIKISTPNIRSLKDPDFCQRLSSLLERFYPKPQLIYSSSSTFFANM